MNDIVWLTMRRLRTPLIVLILVYFLSVFALVLVPGQDDAGRPVQMNFLDAAYFIAIMSTTIGFGEVPFQFTNAQRMLVYVLIFPNVVAWLYSIGTIIGLFLDSEFKRSLARSRFQRQVAWMGEPFYIVCGFGNTGSMVVRGLLRRGRHAIVIDHDDHLISTRELDDDFAHVPMLAGETTKRENLELAGMHDDKCMGVIVTTNDDHDNLTIAITTKLMRPDLQVLTRSEDESISDNMKSFNTDYVINPYKIFAQRLFIALSSPIKYLVQDWLISVPGDELRTLVEPPTGRWIVCGAGRFGQQMIRQLEKGDMPFTVVEVDPELLEDHPGAILGRGTEAQTLEEAGIGDAVGIIAGTENDIDNLSICMTARDLKRDLFIVARQEQADNQQLFDRLAPDLVARRSLIVARRILAVATTPLLRTFLDRLVNEDDAFAERTESLLRQALASASAASEKRPLRAPHLWVADLSTEGSLGARVAREAGVSLKLDDLVTNSRSEVPEPLSCVCLVLKRGAQRIFLPSTDTELQEGDELLFAGRGSAELEMTRALHDPVLLWDAATVESMPRSAFWRAFRRNGKTA